MTKNEYLAAISLLIVLIIDILTPTEFVVDILYLCCILFVFKQNPKTIIIFSTAACLIIVTNVLFVDIKLKLSLSVLVNRAISLFAIIITSRIAIHYRKLNQMSIFKEQRHLKEMEEMLFIISHGARKPVANILGLADIINSDSDALSMSDLKKQCQYLHYSANELDNFIKELNTFVEQIEQESLVYMQNSAHNEGLHVASTPSASKQLYKADDKLFKNYFRVPATNLYPRH
jgi:signal transduction histidine kinase